MLYEIANNALLDISAFSTEARAFLEEERYLSYIPKENVNPSLVLIETIPVVIDELADYGILVKNDPADIAESGPLILSFFVCAKYLLPNGIHPMIRSDKMLLSIYEDAAASYSTSSSDIVTNILMTIGGSANPYIPNIRNACIDVLESLDIVGTGQYADILSNMCDIVRTARASDMAGKLEYVQTVHGYFEALHAYYIAHAHEIPAWDMFKPKLDSIITKLMSILTSEDVMDNYADVMFITPTSINLTIPVLALVPITPLYWQYNKQPIGGGDPLLKYACEMFIKFNQEGNAQ